jgi:hypothetical protein
MQEEHRKGSRKHVNNYRIECWRALPRRVDCSYVRPGAAPGSGAFVSMGGFVRIHRGEETRSSITGWEYAADGDR